LIEIECSPPCFSGYLFHLQYGGEHFHFLQVQFMQMHSFMVYSNTGTKFLNKS
jgi:hypothetical protein